jgi:hypothetical protein
MVTVVVAIMMAKIAMMVTRKVALGDGLLVFVMQQL